jgi:hypothetical protein
MSIWADLAGAGMTAAGIYTMNPALIAGGVGTLAGDANNTYKRNQENANIGANAEALRYSPWTHMNPGMMKAQTGSDAMAAAQGGLAGAMFGSQFGKTAAPTAADTAGINAVAQGTKDVNQYMPLDETPAMNGYTGDVSGPNAPLPQGRGALPNPSYFRPSPWGMMRPQYG